MFAAAKDFQMMLEKAMFSGAEKLQGLARPRRKHRTAVAGAHIAVMGLSHTYRRSDGPVLEDISFQVEPGEVVALLGRSGCGKSTLLHMLSGLTLPSQGEVVINGNTVRGPSNRWVMMFQAPSLFPWMTVAQNAALGLRFARRNEEIARRVPEVLDLVDLAAFADRNAQDLSGGQQQRVALARSLATRPEMLLLDEPFSALDAFTRRALQRDVRKIAHNLGLTLVIVTHDVSEAVRMADRVLVLDANPGRIAQDTVIDLDDDEREGGCDRFNAEHVRLMEIYTAVAHGAADETDDTPEKA
ncbi:NitT/TauT family transport system ATP-binding protein [Lutimaribacter saemankumensis]|uniref:NitT/TauT family transport system ATP-binding protein n=2 Tax=Lutimaribacter saemankumensis TaxID=490829 RepID=A0A1G8K2C5_9RHOB|nr:NitT/TauT family transport system ATP-binding protein [Lutimaribacter saemankumensis]